MNWKSGLDCRVQLKGVMLKHILCMLTGFCPLTFHFLHRCPYLSLVVSWLFVPTTRCACICLNIWNCSPSSNSYLFVFAYLWMCLCFLTVSSLYLLPFAHKWIFLYLLTNGCACICSQWVPCICVFACICSPVGSWQADPRGSWRGSGGRRFLRAAPWCSTSYFQTQESAHCSWKCWCNHTLHFLTVQFWRKILTFRRGGSILLNLGA